MQLKLFFIYLATLKIETHIIENNIITLIKYL